MDNNSVLDELFGGFVETFSQPAVHLNTDEGIALCGSQKPPNRRISIEEEAQVTCHKCLDILKKAKRNVEIMIELEQERGYLQHALDSNLSEHPPFRKAWEDRITDIEQCLLFATHPRNPAESKAMSMYREKLEKSEGVIQ